MAAGAHAAADVAGREGSGRETEAAPSARATSVLAGVVAAVVALRTTPVVAAVGCWACSGMGGSVGRLNAVLAGADAPVGSIASPVALVCPLDGVCS